MISQVGEDMILAWPKEISFKENSLSKMTAGRGSLAWARGEPALRQT